MKIKDNSNIILPGLTGSSFNGMDRFHLVHKDLILKKVNQREDNGNIKIITQAKDGHEQRTGWVTFGEKVTTKMKNELYDWLLHQTEKDIETIYNSELPFL